MNHHPRIFVAGCGYTGERCADFFSAAGSPVTGLDSSAASAERLAAKPYPVMTGDASDASALQALLHGEKRPQVLIHCLSGPGGRDAAAYRITYLATLRHLLEILQPEFCVFTSSTSVYDQNDGTWVTEDCATGGTPIGDVLMEAENLARAVGGAAVRLGGIYGPGRSRFIQAARSGEPAASGPPDGFINFIHRDDAARALVHVARQTLAGAFNAVDSLPAPRSSLREALRTGTNTLTTPAGAMTGKQVSNAKLRASGWTPRYPSILDAVRDSAV
ncbi:MAG: NAD-dependent epimerase/dehydratase family protein [Chthoniobacterales bacterium]